MESKTMRQKTSSKRWNNAESFYTPDLPSIYGWGLIRNFSGGPRGVSDIHLVSHISANLDGLAFSITACSRLCPQAQHKAKHDPYIAQSAS